MNNKGFLRIVEASISIVILIGVIFFLFLQARPVTSATNYDEMARDILEEVAYNPSLRIAVLNQENTELNGFFGKRIPSGSLEYGFAICGIKEACGLDRYIEGEVFAQERVISAEIGHPTYNPKKIRLFIWRK